jgi:hypothetical protein
MRIAIVADSGYRFKGITVEALPGGDHEVDDLGTDSEGPVDSRAPPSSTAQGTPQC